MGIAPELVHDYGFPSDAEGTTAPYGIYDKTANTGSFFVGKSYDTPEFVAECVTQWWKTEGQTRYSEATELIIFADSGGSNGCRTHGNTSRRTTLPTRINSTLPWLTTQPEPANGTRSNTDCSARSQRTGQA